MPQDMAQRVSLARVDDQHRRVVVSLAREIIYHKNFAVNSSAVEKLLKPESLVPTTVSFSLYGVNIQVS